MTDRMSGNNSSHSNLLHLNDLFTTRQKYYLMI